ncbi:DUF1254 domain-containing protein [Myxococcus sp. RHSTA-1-4]|uniref:DUF1254 domain-containing protein n=1 Tax=Myxococcus sp. RHSTA-1-4 TaxID=2874601 RepID=UPI001CBFB9C1|nr:DUF1254 domain-containing protein [Myxococcus sp. RHSTA-1-4]MBZ4421282.1 DUF1254 domain-containing protein [Myxococcus sp. RHSTA-1-4]
MLTSIDPHARWGDLANLPFLEGYPTKESADALRAELQFERAVQVYLWALPAMNLFAMRKAQERQFGAGASVMAIWHDRLDAKPLVTTPNPDVIHAMAWLDLKRDGPVVIEAPPGLQGLLDDAWHRPLTDVGLAGPDQGKGGKYLLVPADHEGEIPDGYFTLRSPTHGVFVFWRAFLEAGRSEPGVALLQRTRIYPLARKDAPPAMRFVSASGVPLNLDSPRDITYFENLASFINNEPAAPEDFAMRGMAATLGIVKGRPFQPDAHMKSLLETAAQVGFKMSTAVAYADDPSVQAYEDRMWRPGFHGGSPVFKTDTYLDVDAMLASFHSADSTRPAMTVAMPGRGAQYLGGLTDADGDNLLGERSYRLHVPADVPVLNYWSVVLHDADTRALLDNGERIPSIASNSNLRLNPDGSADIFFGPEAPKDGSANWLKTVPGRGWFAAIRLYSPTQAFFDKTWRPGNIEKVRERQTPAKRASLEQLATEAFLYGFPLVEGVSGQVRLSTVPVASVAAPVNTFGHETTLATPERSRKAGVVSPNSDTLYTVAQVDVGPEPLVFRVPDIQGRYYVFQFIDAWTNNFAYVGLRSAGEHAGEFLLVPPGWSGEAPQGMRVIRAPTRLFMITGRLLVNGEEDIPNATKLAAALALIPLSQYPRLSDTRSRKLGDWPLPQPEPNVPQELMFWERLRTWAMAYPPHPDDAAYQQRFEPLGLLAQRSPYVGADPALAAALRAGEEAARATIDQEGQRLFPLRNNWQAAWEMFNYNTHFFEFGTLDAPRWKIAQPERSRLVRAVAARLAIWGNQAYEAFYPFTFLDADGAPLSGEHRYVVHFDQPPPVDGFWSLTMYDAPDFMLVDNPLRRYAIGDRTQGLQYNPDGSLDLYLQKESPGPGRESNWLPAPAGRFRPMLRMYVPRSEAFDDGKWRLPPIRRGA